MSKSVAVITGLASLQVSQKALAELKRVDPSIAKLSPAQVLTLAARPESALHDYFTWDDTEAAHNFRLLEAGRVIKSVVKMLPAPDRTPVRIQAQPALTTPSIPVNTTVVSESWAAKTVEVELNRMMQAYSGFPKIVRALTVAKMNLLNPPPPGLIPALQNNDDRFSTRATHIAKELSAVERSIFLYLPKSGEWRDLTGPSMGQAIRSLWRRYENDDFISLEGVSNHEKACLKSLGKLIRGNLANA